MLSMHVLVLSFVKLVQELKSFVVSFGLLDHPPNEHQSMPRHAVYNIIIPK